MQTFINGSEKVSVSHTIQERGNDLYLVVAGVGEFVLMANSENDAIARLKDNLQQVLVKRENYDKKDSSRLNWILGSKMKAKKLDNNQAYPVCYFDDSRNI